MSFLAIYLKSKPSMSSYSTLVYRCQVKPNFQSGKRSTIEFNSPRLVQIIVINLSVKDQTNNQKARSSSIKWLKSSRNSTKSTGQTSFIPN